MKVERAIQHLPDARELAQLPKAARVAIYIAMALFGCAYWFVFLWFATAEGS